MYLWTGDVSYVEDPVFRNFQDRSVADYVERWSLDLDRRRFYSHVLQGDRFEGDGAQALPGS
jgi:hypothetical protein